MFLLIYYSICAPYCSAEHLGFSKLHDVTTQKTVFFVIVLCTSFPLVNSSVIRSQEANVWNSDLVWNKVILYLKTVCEVQRLYLNHIVGGGGG
jgi:hypothetical protein